MVSLVMVAALTAACAARQPADDHPVSLRCSGGSQSQLDCGLGFDVDIEAIGRWIDEHTDDESTEASE
ncbi:MAG: hypothetical protein QF578_01600 [Alphaproteobacteria bacterium]|jgi:hypothetical protein|nr:hypothetical protein [Alphaproteobacteria bacterium]MDP6563498.1 hypothetical protein [Alphaproteobacteria bacterium]MDP6812684.1 hypothetical protein [Alphaproteobacteria bacterium]|tara:strand:+ start:167 stop:370 length:204 start_codon:yes stop_codon:yes gene_type:complete